MINIDCIQLEFIKGKDIILIYYSGFSDATKKSVMIFNRDFVGESNKKLEKNLAFRYKDDCIALSRLKFWKLFIYSNWSKS